MNKFYKSVWNEALGAWVATSENCPARGKRSGRLAKAVVASAITFSAAGGVSAHVTLDGGTLDSSPYATTVSQSEQDPLQVMITV
jgi:hypothetical protein